MAADCSFFRLPMAFTTVCAPYCRADGSGLLILPNVKGFHNGLCTVLLSGWQQIAHSCACQWLSQWFAHCIAEWIAVDCSYFRSSTAFTKLHASYGSTDGIGLLIPSLVNGFHNSLCTVLLRGWQQIADSSTRQLLLRFVRRFAQRMVADSSLFRSSRAFTTVYTTYCSVDGSRLLIPPLANGFPDGLRADFLSGWECIARSSTRQRLSRFVCRIAPRMAEDCSFFHLSMAFPVWEPFCSADDSALLILPFVKGCLGLHAVFPNGWQWIARSSARQWLSRRFACLIAPWMVVECSYFRSSKAFTMVCAPYFCADVSGLLILLLVNGFRGLRAVLLSEWLWIAHSCARQRLSRLFACRFPQWMVVHCWFFHLSTAFTVGVPFPSADESALLVLPLVNGFHTLCTVLLNGWQPIARSSAHQLLSRFVHRIAQRMAPDCSFFRLSTALSVCVPFCSADDSTFLLLLFVNGFHGLRAILPN